MQNSKPYFSKQSKPKPSNYKALSQKERDDLLLSRPVQPVYLCIQGLICIIF